MQVKQVTSQLELSFLTINEVTLSHLFLALVVVLGSEVPLRVLPLPSLTPSRFCGVDISVSEVPPIDGVLEGSHW